MWKAIAPILTGTCLFLAVAAMAADKPEAALAQKKVSEVRLKGMKDALVDLEKGFIKQKDYNDRPDSRSWRAFVELVTKECGVVWETVKRDRVSEEEMGGYNDVMRAEIEHRFGRGIFEELHKKAEEEK
jgi:hypothetical protein